MGFVHFGAPVKEVEFLKENLGLKVFVEGGTYHGDSAKKMSKVFDKVYTIEMSNKIYGIAKENLKNISNVILIKGDTREHLNKIIEENDNILFWLDSHWSGGDTYGEDDECPLLQELGIIFQYTKKNYIILVDDARLFLSPPPKPHKFHNWPSMKEITSILPKNYDVIVFEDVMYIYNLKYNDIVKTFFQSKATEQWRKYGEDNSISFINGLKMMIKSLIIGKIT